MPRLMEPAAGPNSTVRAGHVVALAALLFVWNVWAYDLWAPDEPYFAEGAREMLVDGKWAVPHVNGKVTTDKPPLFFWLIAALSLPLGKVGSFTARLPSALAMIAATAMTMRLARRLVDERTGVLAGVVFATTYLVWDKGRSAQIDALLCALVLSAVSAFEAFRSGDVPGKKAGLLFWTAAALATLAKGPVGFLLPLGIVLATLAADRKLGSWRRFAPWSGPALFLAIVAVWMAIATVGGAGTYSVWSAFREHVLDRAVHGMHHKQPFWYYAEVLPLQLVPWSALVPAAIVAAARPRHAGDRLLLVWVGFVVLFFSIPVEKRDLYVLPAYPAFAMLVARLGSATRWATVPHGLLAALLLVLGVVAPIAVPRLGYLSVGRALGPSLLLAATGIAALALLLRGRLQGAVVATAAGMAAAYLAAATFVFPALDPIKSARAFSRRVAELTAVSRAEGHAVLAYDVGNLPEALAFYSDGLYTEEVGVPAAVEEHLAQAGRVFAVIPEDAVASLRARSVVVESRELSGRRVALVANR
jgi:4-amino-4-deoxy-L-arabinose transferase-like glycosyltransferase